MQTRYFHLTDFKRRENGFQVNPHLKTKQQWQIEIENQHGFISFNVGLGSKKNCGAASVGSRNECLVHQQSW